MSDAGNNDYSIRYAGGTLVFRTTSFSADTASVLHTGIYNREFASVLASMALAGLVYTLLVVNYGRSLVAYAAFILLLVGGFVVFREFIFEARYLEAVFDKDGEVVTIAVAGLRKKTKDRIPLKSVTGVMLEKKKSEIENPDGVKFVEKISLQHGVVIPGFGEARISYLLKLNLSDGSDRLIYVAGEMKDALDAHEAIKGFLGL